MGDQRKQTIINEIKYWKSHRLLPSEYCDYLLALYSEGDDHSNDEDLTGEKKRKNLPFSGLYTVLILILLPLSFLVIYFTEMDIIMQTGLLSSFVLIAFIQFIRLRYEKSEQLHVPLIVGLLILFLLTVQLLSHFYTSNASIYASIPVHSLFWFFLGARLKIKYLQISSFVGMILLIIIIVL